MVTRKRPMVSKCLISRLRTFVDALSKRYQRALQVVDEALDSDNLKEKMWAVNLILKQTPPVGPDAADDGKKDVSGETLETPGEEDADLDRLEEGELIRRIRSYLRTGPE